MAKRKAGQPATATVNTLQALLDSCAERLGYLRDRWQDEKEFEDFAAYIAEMKKLVPTNDFTFVRAQKRPFGFVVQPKGSALKFLVVAKAGTISVEPVPQ
jgi:hypothetical protein